MGFNGPVSINQLAIHKAMELYCVSTLELADQMKKDIREDKEELARESLRAKLLKQDCFEKVVRLGRWWIERQREG